MRKTMLSGQVYGMVDKVDYAAKTILTYIHEYSDRSRQVRCILEGPAVSAWIAKHPGVADRTLTITAHGRLTARSYDVRGSTVNELVCIATEVDAEAAPPRRVAGAVLANLKGIVHHWDAARSKMIRTYINSARLGEAPRVDCLVSMTSIGEDAAVLEHIAPGREYIGMVSVELSHYNLTAEKGGARIPVLRLTPRTFRLQA